MRNSVVKLAPFAQKLRLSLPQLQRLQVEIQWILPRVDRVIAQLDRLQPAATPVDCK